MQDGQFDDMMRRLERREAASRLPAARPAPQLQRARQGRLISGVSAGLAERFGVQPIVIRLAFVIATLWTSGLVAIAYLVLWAVLPEEQTIEDVLAERLESGEIAADEYRQILADIGLAQDRRRRRRRG